MRHFPRLTAALAGILVAMLVFVAGGEISMEVGRATNSGILGICGPYGPHSDLVGSIFFVSLFGGALIGGFVRWDLYQRLSRPAKSPAPTTPQA